MSLGEIVSRPEISYFELAPSVEQARQLIAPAKARLAERDALITKPFMVVQGLFCGYFLISWVMSGHYILGPIFAILLWCVTWIFYWPLTWFTRRQRRELKQAEDNVWVVLHKELTDFLARQELGPYRWISREGRMLALFPESALLYLYAPESNYQHAFIDAPNVVRQVRVDEKTQTHHTSHTHTTHGERQVRGGYGSPAIIGTGHSNSTTHTSSSTAHYFSLQIQCQVGAQTPFWTTWDFGSDWEEAENWRLQIAQAAGLDIR